MLKSTLMWAVYGLCALPLVAAGAFVGALLPLGLTLGLSLVLAMVAVSGINGKKNNYTLFFAAEMVACSLSIGILLTRPSLPVATSEMFIGVLALAAIACGAALLKALHKKISA